MSAARSRPVSHPDADRRQRTDPWRVGRRAGALAIAGLLLAGPATAHPFVRGGELPVDSLATMTLAMAHGCASETSGEGDPTTEVSMEVPAWLRVVEVAKEDGWVVDLEEDDGVPEVVTWIADGAVGPDPDFEFELDVVATGEIGDERYLRVFQACDDFAYRWVGTPDEPAENPAVRVTLTEADPDSPPPPEPAPETEPEPEPESELETEPEPEPESEPEADPEPEPLSTQSDDGGLPGWLLPVTVVVLLGGLGALLLGRRARTDA